MTILTSACSFWLAFLEKLEMAEINQTLHRLFFVIYYFLHCFRQSDFLVLTRNWHLLPFGFIWCSLNHVNRLSVKFSDLGNTVYKSESHVWGDYHQYSWQYHIHKLQKTCHKCLCWKEEDLISFLSEVYALYQRRAVGIIYFCYLFSFVKITENEI